MAEEVFDCVQCGARYLEIENQVLGGACSFHPEPTYDRCDFDGLFVHVPLLMSRYPACCGSYNPCKKGAHRPKHHCDYPYANFFKMANDIRNYVDTHETWAEASDTNLITNKEQIGMLLAARTGGLVSIFLFAVRLLLLCLEKCAIFYVSWLCLFLEEVWS
jgi:hypothetical protein